MKLHDIDAVRKLYDLWASRKGKGSIKLAAQATGVSRQTLTKFRKDGPLSQEPMDLLLQLMAKDGFVLPQKAEPNLRLLKPPDLEDVLATRFEAIGWPAARFLRRGHNMAWPGMPRGAPGGAGTGTRPRLAAGSARNWAPWT